MGRNTGKVCWHLVRKCLKGHSEELVMMKDKKKEDVRGGKRRERGGTEMVRSKEGL